MFGLQLPKLPELDPEDLKAARSFMPGKLLGRTATLLALVLLVFNFAGALPTKAWRSWASI